jgi:uncharacterized protein YktB (UPF0637 family)
MQMNQFTGFTALDFEGFALPALEERMAFIKAGPRPKLEALGQDLAPRLSALTGQPMYPITAKHLRRTVNPPNDTWVAWSASKSGYKMLPHYQVGMWETHAFIQAGVIYEAASRPLFAENLLANMDALQAALPPRFRWLEDSTQPTGILNADMTEADFRRMAEKLKTKKESDCMVGLAVDAAEAVRLGPAFADLAWGVMQQLLPIFDLARAPITL